MTGTRNPSAALRGSLGLAGAQDAFAGTDARVGVSQRIHGVVAHTVGQRLREIGIRVAVGASGGAVVRLIVGDYGRFVAVGVALGLAVVLLLGNLLGALTPAWAGLDPRIVAGSAAAVTAAALASAFLPARRAASSDPLQALKQE